MVNILTGQAEVRPELALAILERKFRTMAKVTVVAPASPSDPQRRRHPPESSKRSLKAALKVSFPATIINAP